MPEFKLSSRKHLARERLTMRKMVGIYCAAHHDCHEESLCMSCRDFLNYADLRLRKCPFGEHKPTCSNCPVHCYKKERKEEAREIMRFAGPRMLLRHPILAIAHQLDGFRKAEHPREHTREQRMRPRR